MSAMVSIRTRTNGLRKRSAGASFIQVFAAEFSSPSHFGETSASGTCLAFVDRDATQTRCPTFPSLPCGIKKSAFNFFLALAFKEIPIHQNQITANHNQNRKPCRQQIIQLQIRIPSNGSHL